jgi:hypothetical protein
MTQQHSELIRGEVDVYGYTIPLTRSNRLGTFQLEINQQICVTDAFWNRARDAFNVLTAGMPAVVTTRL